MSGPIPMPLHPDRIAAARAMLTRADRLSLMTECERGAILTLAWSILRDGRAPTAATTTGGRHCEVLAFRRSAVARRAPSPFRHRITVRAAKATDPEDAA